MGFSLENGYIPESVEELMGYIRQNVNTQFQTSYTAESFLGTNHYKYYYSVIQRLQANQVKVGEIFLKLQQYFRITNELINRPKVTDRGLVETFKEAGYNASVKEPIEADAGKRFVCVNVPGFIQAGGYLEVVDQSAFSGETHKITIAGIEFTGTSGAVTPGEATFSTDTDEASVAASIADQINNHEDVSPVVSARSDGAFVYLLAVVPGTGGNTVGTSYSFTGSDPALDVFQANLSGGEGSPSLYEAKKAEIASIIENGTAGGIVTMGNQSHSVTYDNGQTFEWRYLLPRRIPVSLQLTIETSENNTVAISSPTDTKARLLANIAERYNLGKNFEPQRYFSIDEDAPWAAQILLEWSTNGGLLWSNEVYDSDFDELFVIDPDNVSIIET